LRRSQITSEGGVAFERFAGMEQNEAGVSAGAFSLSVAIPSDGFSVTNGEPVIGGLHGATRHYFCPRCMTWMFTRPEGLDWFVNLRATMLDNPAWFSPFVETWTGEKLPWATTPAVHSFEALPAIEDYDGLLKAFAEEMAKPAAQADPSQQPAARLPVP
jgi:hypothetical protein